MVVDMEDAGKQSEGTEEKKDDDEVQQTTKDRTTPNNHNHKPQDTARNKEF
jgi:hypothetical protein